MARPRTLTPDGKSAKSAAVSRSHQRLRDRGGKRVVVALEPDALAALAVIRERGAYSSDAKAIAAALIATLNRF
jgi:hypothetical protein